MPGTITVAANSNCASSSATAISVNMVAPAIPTTLTGPTAICSYVGTATQAVYVTNVVSGAVSYLWTVPTGATIATGQGTTSISVTYGSTAVSGSITVASVSNCATSGIKSLAVTKTVPGTPTAITGPTSMCSYLGTPTVATYTIPTVSGAISYNWTVPSGATITTGQGTTSIGVTYASNALAGAIGVSSVANCGSSGVRTLNITKSIAPPSAIVGVSNVCGLTSTTYTTTSTAATSFVWTVPAGWIIISGQGTSSITVGPFASPSAAGVLRVAAVNGCGTSSNTSLSIAACLDPIGMNNNSSEAETNNVRFSDIYPNPTSSEFTISVEMQDARTKNQAMILEMYDLLGNLVKSQQLTVSNGVTSISTNIEQLNSGLYFVKLVDINNNTLYSQKVVKD